MKEIEKQQAPGVSGGYRPSPDGGGCIPFEPFPLDPVTDPPPAVGYPRHPILTTGETQ
jgi:hypothetical protein